ncbi:MAG: AAA domain-containing protein [Bacteroidia bacterium]
MEPASIVHLRKIKDLLQIERDEDLLQYKEQFLRADVNQRRTNGLTWYPVTINNSELSVGEYLQVEVERTTFLNLPHQFSSGKNVLLFSNKNNEIHEIGGTVRMVNRNTMKILLNTDELPDWCYDGKLGVNMQFDDNSYSEMNRALDIVIKAKENRLSELREIIHGTEEAKFGLINENILIPSLNLSQNRAVRKALAARDIAVIHGPPGTGKTTTLVQAIRLTLQNEKQVLVCAPTNTAVDLLVEKLTEQGVNVLRLGHPARVSDATQKTTLDGQMQKHEHFKDIKNLRKNAEEYFKMAGKYKRVFGKEEAQQRTLYYTEAKNCIKEAVLLEDYITDNLLQNAQVIACTPVVSTSRYLRGKNFDTLFFDEASQALEPMSWIPILKCKRVILSGDHFQLPPVVKSKIAEAGGLKETLFERCIKKPGLASLLTLQYRMHNHIMSFSNALFYNNELEADASVKDTLLSYNEEDHLLNKSIEFIDTAGCGFEEQLNPESLSLANPEEAALIWKHLALLTEQYLRSHNKTEFDLSIGIIAPYKEQTELLKEQFNELITNEQLKKKISVKTIDGFQGEERDIIYISFVRSNSNSEIGFLSDVRRTNVALTRARKKLIMIGDSATLAAHEFYRKLIDYCEKTGGYGTAWEYMDQ